MYRRAPGLLVSPILSLCFFLAPLAPLAVAPPLTAADPSAVPVGSRLPATPAGLDRSGRRLPRTSYAIPRGAIFLATNGNDANRGTRSRPVRSLNRAVALAPNNGTIVLRGGQYRDWHGGRRGYKVIAKSLTFQAYPTESPWLNGANVVGSTRWRKVPGQNRWYVAWSTPQFCSSKYYSRPLSKQSRSPNNGPCSHFDMSSSSRDVSNDPQMVFVNGIPLRQQASVASLRTSSFHYDWAKRRLYLAANPAGKRIEVARRPVALVLGGGRNYRIRGIGFHQYASNQFHNATTASLYIGGSRALVENSVFARNAGGALSLSKPRPGSLVRRSVFADNGYTALGANGGAPNGSRNGLVVDGNVLVRNNAESFGDRCTVSCGQAGAKFAHMIGLRISRNLVSDTRGRSAGLWCDLDCRDVQYVYNTVVNNGGSGIFHEVSDTGIIAGNLLRRNAYGVRVASANTKVYNNTLVDNVQGIKVYDDRRSRNRGGWRDVGPDTRNVEVVNNVVAGRNYALMGEAASRDAGPPNIDADNLFARIDYNSYHQSNGSRPVFVYWRDRRQRETLFRSRTAFVAAKRGEQRSHWLGGSRDPLFVNRAAGDYRVRGSSPAYRTAASLPRDVAAALGVRQQMSGRSRGASVR